MKLQLASGLFDKEFEFVIFTNKGDLKLTGGFIGHYSNLGVNFSGGIDSLALLCLILTELKRIDRLDTMRITCFTVIKNDGCTYYAGRLLNQVRNKFKCDIEHITNIENPNANELPSWFDSNVMLPIIKSRKNMVLYSGMNVTPPKSVVTFNHVSLSYKDEAYKRKHRIVTPFYYFYKPQILDILYKLNCDDLLPYTHSCTMMPVGQCNNCYSCEERAWGFRELGKIDPGTISPEIEDISYGGTWKFFSN